MKTEKTPQKAKLLLGLNKTFSVARIHYDTKLVTLQESEKVFNTVSIENVVFDFSDFTREEIAVFMKKFD